MKEVILKTKEAYDNNYIFLESLGCILIPVGLVMCSFYLSNLSYFHWSYFHWFSYILLLIFFVVGIIWTVMLASILGKVLFGGVVALIYIEFSFLLFVVLAAILTTRLYILWYIPKSKNYWPALLSRFELFNRQINLKETAYTNLFEKKDMDLISRLASAGYVDINNLLHYALEKSDLDLVELFLKMGADSLEDTEKDNKKDEDGPLLKVVFLDELNKDKSLDESISLDRFNLTKARHFDLKDNYVYLLQQDPGFWTGKFQKIFTGGADISTNKAGYLLVISKHEYRSKVNKEVKVAREKKALISMSVGVIRAKDEIEEALQESFFNISGGKYVFPSNLTPVFCNKCEGKGLKDCPLGCESGKVSCSNPDCQKGFMKCLECKGKGRITRKCPDCDRGYKGCDICGERGYIECDNCYGKGSVVVEIMKPCPCNKEWKIKCPECDGKGRQKGYICPMCGGDEIICSECNNTGQRPGEQTTQMSCDKCDETGKLGDCNCYDGLIKCENCDGFGIENFKCPVCSGTGVSKCVRCHGKGKENCKRCKGLGKISCSYCQGSGKMYEVTYTRIEYEKCENKNGRCRILFPEDGETVDDFNGISPEFLDKLYRGKTDLIRIISREKIDKHEIDMIDKIVRGSGVRLEGLNRFVEKNKSDGPGVLMEIIDVMPVKYDIVGLSDGDKIIIFNEKDGIDANS